MLERIARPLHGHTVPPYFEKYFLSFLLDAAQGLRDGWLIPLFKPRHVSLITCTEDLQVQASVECVLDLCGTSLTVGVFDKELPQGPTYSKDGSPIEIVIMHHPEDSLITELSQQIDVPIINARVVQYVLVPTFLRRWGVERYTDHDVYVWMAALTAAYQPYKHRPA